LLTSLPRDQKAARFRHAAIALFRGDRDLPQPTAGFKPCIGTVSVGEPGARFFLEHKLEAIRAAGFLGIELHWDDLEAYCLALFLSATKQKLLEAAKEVRLICDEHGITIVSIQPYRCVSKDYSNKRLEWFETCLACADVLGAGIVGVPAYGGQVGDLRGFQVLADDIAELAQLAAEYDPPIKIAYESQCFAPVVKKWEQAMYVIDLVIREGVENVGIILDTFDICGSTWADPLAYEGISISGKDAFDSSMDRLTGMVRSDRVLLVQLADAERLHAPLDEDHPLSEENQTPKETWSKKCRLFPHEAELGAYLPLTKLLRKIEKRYTGW
jgi:4-hydroxyphenylpyruvate dioxygenase